MRIYGKGFTLTIVFVALTFALTLVGWSGSANQGVGPQEANKQETTPEHDVPLLDLKQAEKTGPEQLKGRKRGQSLRQDRQSRINSISGKTRVAQTLP